MRILHTSDWHLGQNFMGKSRQAEHAALINWLLEQVQVHAVDAVLIAGDIYDTGAPPSYARELYADLVVRLHAARVELLLLGGNHDSVATLRENSALVHLLSATVVPSVQAPQDQVCELHLRGSQSVGCIVCAVPFIRPRDVVKTEFGQSAEERQLQLQTSIKQFYAATYDAACVVRERIANKTGERLPIIATGHLTTVGASSSESVREIYVGTLDAFPTSEFPPVDYLALGHIHKAQKVGGHEHIRYCGSPIMLSFDELKQQKQMLLVDLNASGLQSVTSLEVPTFQRLKSLRGDLKTLEEALSQTAEETPAGASTWVEVTVTADDYLPDLPARLQLLVQGSPIELLRIRRERGTPAAQWVNDTGITLDELDPCDVFARRLSAEADMEPELKQQLEERYRRVIADLHDGDHAA
jgi:exonuclease SbcD